MLRRSAEQPQQLFTSNKKASTPKKPLMMVATILMGLIFGNGFTAIQSNVVNAIIGVTITGNASKRGARLNPMMVHGTYYQ